MGILMMYAYMPPIHWAHCSSSYISTWQKAPLECAYTAFHETYNNLCCGNVTRIFRHKNTLLNEIAGMKTL